MRWKMELRHISATLRKKKNQQATSHFVDKKKYCLRELSAQLSLQAVVYEVINRLKSRCFMGSNTPMQQLSLPYFSWRRDPPMCGEMMTRQPTKLDHDFRENGLLLSVGPRKTTFFVSVWGLEISALMSIRAPRKMCNWRPKKIKNSSEVRDCK